MNSTQPSPSPRHDRGVLADVLGFRPAPTLSRELFALVVNALLVAVVLVVFQPPLLAVVLIAVLCGAWLIGRLVIGARIHGYGRDAGAGR
ncbi:hypothetical protein [Brachybacterium hainanense]|uniref:Uncharacterized protein n=1 Tax=Brachybacterium hainanense TaxID=1541174 RepID=A0ABV6R776_9MICO